MWSHFPLEPSALYARKVPIVCKYIGITCHYIYKHLYLSAICTPVSIIRHWLMDICTSHLSYPRAVYYHWHWHGLPVSVQENAAQGYLLHSKCSGTHPVNFHEGRCKWGVAVGLECSHKTLRKSQIAYTCQGSLSIIPLLSYQPFNPVITVDCFLWANPCDSFVVDNATRVRITNCISVCMPIIVRALVFKLLGPKYQILPTSSILERLM